MSTFAVSRAPLFGPQALGAVFVVLWSSAWIAGKVGLEFTGPLTLLVIRFSAAALVMLPVALLSGAPWPRKWSEYGHLTVASLLINGLTLAALYTGINDGVSAGISALIAGLTPLLTALAAGPLLGERIGAARWVGLVIGLLGVALAVMNKISFASGGWEGYAITFLALGAFVAGTLYQKKFCGAIDLRTGNLVQFIVAGIGLFIPALAFEGLRRRAARGMEPGIDRVVRLAGARQFHRRGQLVLFPTQTGGGEPRRRPVLSGSADHRHDGVRCVPQNAEPGCRRRLRSGRGRRVPRRRSESALGPEALADLQRRNLVAGEREHEPDFDGTAGKVSGQAAGDDDPVAFPRGCERLDRVLVFPLRLGLPRLDGGQSLVGAALVADDGVGREAFRQRFDVAGAFGLDVKSDRRREADGHRSFHGRSAASTPCSKACSPYEMS